MPQKNLGLPSIIEKMVQLIAAIECETKNLMITIKKFKEKRKRHSSNSSSDDDSDSDSSSKRTSIGQQKVASTLEKIGYLEKEIKQICGRISTLNHCLHNEGDDEGKVMMSGVKSSKKHSKSKISTDDIESDFNL